MERREGPEQRHRAITLKRQRPSWGAARIKRTFALPLSDKALRKIWHQEGLMKQKRRKHKTKQDLRAIKAPWRLFEQVETAHGLIENEFYEVEPFTSREEFLAKAATSSIECAFSEAPKYLIPKPLPSFKVEGNRHGRGTKATTRAGAWVPARRRQTPTKTTAPFGGS
ncbi:MAG: hypothetical protein ACK4Z6_00700 [Candidatus Methylomirabilales bacterium]